MKTLLILTTMVLISSVVLPIPTSFAQDDTCPQLVQNSYELTQAACEDIGTDEACYGNIRISAKPDTLAFTESGDIVDVAEIESLRLSSMDTETNEWGISLMHINALADVDAALQTVDIVLFGDVEIENAAESDSEFAPMQAFTFRSGVAEPTCEDAPESGILIQTAEGVGEITLYVNEVLIDIGSTIYLQAEAGAEMSISVVEGRAAVTAFETTVEVPAGSRARVPLDDDGIADGQPEGPEPYVAADLETLPIVLLADQVAIAPPIAASATASDDEPALVSGEWQFTITDNSCDPSVIGETFNAEIMVDPENDTLIWPVQGEEPGVFSLAEPGVYTSEQGDATLRMEAITEEEMRLVITWADDCQDFLSLQLVAPTE